MTFFRDNLTRILGNDNLWAGLSSFAVEMTEFREILRYADARSLVLGDELLDRVVLDRVLQVAELTRAGFAVPPGFTISTEACRWFYGHNGNWPPGLEDEVRAHLAQLEAATERTFGKGEARLLLAIRSGAPVSMPGRLTT